MKSFKVLFSFLFFSHLSILNINGQVATNYQKLVCKWNSPGDSSSFPAVLVIGGSEGGLDYGQYWVKSLDEIGFGVMSLAYFAEEGLYEQLEEIPLEYFQLALDSLKRIKGVDTNRIAIISVSKGTEPALLLAIDNPNLKLVVLASPSHLIWQGINRENYNSCKSSWTKKGKPVPFEKYDYSKGFYPLINFYLAGVENPSNDSAIIRAEKVNAKILLLSGGKDLVWPASKMASQIANRYGLTHSSNEIIFKDFPNAGHGFLLPYFSEEDKQEIVLGIKPNIDFLGGTIEEFEKAMTSSFELVLNELKKL